MFDQSVMLWSTDGFPKMVNGGSGFFPNSTTEIRTRRRAFPDAASVEYLRSKGIRTVVVLRAASPAPRGSRPPTSRWTACRYAVPTRVTRLCSCSTSDVRRSGGGSFEHAALRILDACLT